MLIRLLSFLAASLKAAKTSLRWLYSYMSMKSTMMIPPILRSLSWRAASCALEPQENALIRWGPLAGALLFGFSDTLIGIHRFAQPMPGAAFSIILTYWAGQALFAASAIRRQTQTSTEAAKSP